MTDLTPAAENPKSQRKITHTHALAAIFTLFGIGLFVYFVTQVGFDTIIEGIGRIGFDGFAIILVLYFIRLSARALAWKFTVADPHKLRFFDTIQAVIIGEALSTMIPLGILISGTAKAVAVKRRVPLVVGLSSVATENLFFSLGAGLVIIAGGIMFLQNFELPEGWVLTIDLVIGSIFILTILGFIMVIRQWHFLSWLANAVYDLGILKRTLENGRKQIRHFEELVYGFYRLHPEYFVPIALLQILFHALGVAEVVFILSRISDVAPTLYSAFMLESISRVIMVVFKLIPFVIGVDEAGAQFVTEALSLGTGVGVTISIIRKIRVLFWTGVGLLVIVDRELSLGELFAHHETSLPQSETVVADENVKEAG